MFHLFSWISTIYHIFFDFCIWFHLHLAPDKHIRLNIGEIICSQPVLVTDANETVIDIAYKIYIKPDEYDLAWEQKKALTREKTTIKLTSWIMRSIFISFQFDNPHLIYYLYTLSLQIVISEISHVHNHQ